jgi:outer membrane protein OmpA-like peptidoglycan-associated protein
MPSMTDRRSSAFAIALLLGLALACATPRDATLDRLRSDLRAAEADSAVASGASVELYEARKAVDRYEAALTSDDDELEDEDDAQEHLRHLAYVAEQKIQIARTAGTEAALKQQVDELAQKRDDLRLRGRTAEAELAKVRAEAAEQEADAYRRQLEEARARAEQIEIQFQAVEAKETERGLVLTMRDDVLFAFDSAQLQPGAEDALDEVAEFLKEYPERAVAVEGHTDSVGSDDYNDRLSRARANAVARYLERDGVPPTRIDVAGFGEHRPVAPNDNEAGRQQNRRVEIVVENPREFSSAR